jgi:hypothetical protein
MSKGKKSPAGCGSEKVFLPDTPENKSLCIQQMSLHLPAVERYTRLSRAWQGATGIHGDGL